MWRLFLVAAVTFYHLVINMLLQCQIIHFNIFLTLEWNIWNAIDRECNTGPKFQYRYFGIFAFKTGNTGIIPVLLKLKKLPTKLKLLNNYIRVVQIYVKHN